MDNPTFPIALAALKKAKVANERIDALPLPMVFKGTLGTGGTISTLPTASSENEGYVYIVITDGTYAGQSAKAGDTFVSDGSSWVLVPSADEPSVIDDSVISTALTWSSKKISDDMAVKSFTYVGDNSNPHTIKFPSIPKVVLAITGYYDGTTENLLNSFAYGQPYTIENQIPISSLTSSTSSRGVLLSYNDDEITIEASNAIRALNVINQTYTVYYI